MACAGVLALGVGCSSEAESQPPPNPGASKGAGADASTPSASASTEGKVVLGEGWTYDADALTDGFPDVTTIRLGDRIRIWSRAADDWFPMTVALLDEHDISMASFRVDVPPKGTVTGVMPETARPVKKVRITQAIVALDGEPFRPRIGVAEPELTTPRLREMRMISKDREKHPDPKIDPYDKDVVVDPAIEAVTTELLQPAFGRDVILDGETVYFSGSNPWKTRPVSDEEWLDGRIQAYLRGVSNRRRDVRGE